MDAEPDPPAGFFAQKRKVLWFVPAVGAQDFDRAIPELEIVKA
jgi:hypothetical protein